MTSRARRLAAAAATLTLLGLVGSACSSSSDGDGDSAGSGSVSTADEAPATAPRNDTGGAGGDGGDAFAEAPAAPDEVDGDAAEPAPADGGGAADPRPAPGDGRSLIRSGNVELRSDDVAATRFEVVKALRAKGGEIAEDSTSSNEDGEAETALMTLRVPVAGFEALMGDLQKFTAMAGVDVLDSGTTTEDVSTEVIDVDVRVDLQKRSIERISTLIERAENIQDIVGLERELARREADLGSLQKQQTFLADQTSLSTITLSIEKRHEEVEPAPEEDDDSGFLAGLDGGWSAFTTAATGVLTATGALLPFAALALLLAVPLRIWLRRRPAPVRPPVVTADPGA